MSYQPDYIHMRNLIVRAIEGIADKPTGPEDNRSEQYGEMISFLEDMYLNSVLALAGSLLATAKFMKEPEAVTECLRAARMIIELPPVSVKETLDEKYTAMITELNLPDAFQVKTHNEQVAEDILNEATQSDSQ